MPKTKPTMKEIHALTLQLKRDVNGALVSHRERIDQLATQLALERQANVQIAQELRALKAALRAAVS